MSPAVIAGRSSWRPWAKRASASIPLAVASVIQASRAVAPALPHERQKGLAQGIRLGDRGIRLGQLVDIQLRVLRPLRFGSTPR